MTEPLEQPADERQPQQRERWILWRTAPAWLRRGWEERLREVPKASDADPYRLRRIAYL